MRSNAQKYALKIVKDKQMIKRIKKLNHVDVLFVERFEGKNNFINIIKSILVSKLWFKYQWVLLYEAIIIKILKVRESRKS